MVFCDTGILCSTDDHPHPSILSQLVWLLLINRQGVSKKC